MRNSMKTRGYTLIELAIVIGVAGALIATFASAYGLYVKNRIIQATEDNAGAVTSALSNFLIQNGRYPCPARADAKRGDPDYGIETECDPVTNCNATTQTCTDNPNYPSYNVGGCVADASPEGSNTANGEGLCFEQSSAYVSINNFMYLKTQGGIGCFQGNGNGSKSKGWCPGSSGAGTIPAKMLIQPVVRRGVVPFRTLALPEDTAYDGYGSRFSYAVSENQAVAAAYQPNNGGIQILNAQGQDYFNVTVSKPYEQPSGLVSNTNYNGTTLNSPTFSFINEATANPAVGTNTLPAGQFVYGTPGTVSTVEYTMSTPNSTPPPYGIATLSFTGLRIKSGPAADNGGAQFVPTIVIKQSGTPVVSSNATANTSPCAATFSKLKGTWQQYDCQFDGSLISDWSKISVLFGTDTTPNGNNMAIGWVYLALPTPNVGYTDYFMFSSGQDKAGGRLRDSGKIATPCNTATLDGQNCMNKTNAQYVMSQQNDAYVANAAVCNTANCHYDDYVQFFSSTETPLWRVSTASADIRDLTNVELTGGKIAIAQTPSMSQAPVLQVGGSMHADASKAMMTKACDVGDNNCFQVSLLADPAGQAANFTCPAGKYATGFANGQLVCASTQTIPCPTGSIVTGVNADGSLQCTGVVGCQSTTVQECLNTTTGVYDTATIPNGVQNAIYTTPVSGYNYQETYQCGPNPWWTKTSTTGICNCKPVDETYDVPCNNVMAGNWTGTVTEHHVHVCPQDTDSVTQVSNTCQCAPTTQTQTDPAGCGVGFTGTVTDTRDWTCTDTVTGSFTAWTPTSNTCTCQPQTAQTQTLACPTQPSTGTWQQTRTWTCPAGTWSAWTDVQNTCACAQGATKQQTLSCGPGYNTGSDVQTATYDCVSQTWSAWSDTNNTCACTNVPVYQTLSCTSDPSAVAAWTGGINQHKDVTCPGATYGSWVTDSNTCSCTNVSQTQTIACPSPLSGTQTQTQTFDCASQTWSAWTTTSQNCTLTPYVWTAKTSGTKYSDPLSTHAGDSCTTPGAQTPCSSAVPSDQGGGYYHYDTCDCE